MRSPCRLSPERPLALTTARERLGVLTGFYVLMERILYIFFTPEHKTANASAPKGSNRIA